MINKIAILDDYQKVSKDFMDFSQFEGKCEFTIFNEPLIDENEIIETLISFDALIIMRERTVFNSSILMQLKNLKFIFTTGMRNKAIDFETAKKIGIKICGTDINSNPAAEITWALILGLARNLKEEIDNMFQGYWQTTLGFELKGKTLGIIGLGKIGTQVAKIGNAFGMNVVAWSENLNLSYAKEVGVLPMTKEELLKTADFISIHVILGKKYKNLITKKDFSLMKKTSFIINTSRGQVINEEDLVDALKNNKIAGAGLDVFTKEPLPQDHKLRFLSNALLLPHLGYVTAENYTIFYSQIAENIEACLLGKPIRLITL